MAVVNTKATAITNADTQLPKTPNSPWLDGGSLRGSVGTVAVGSTDSATSVYRFMRVPSGARIHSLKIFSDAISGFSAASVGVYDTSANGGAVVSESLFGASIDLSVPQTEPYDVIFNNLGIQNVEKRIWELLGLSVDPMTMYDICITGDTEASGSGNLSLIGEYVI